MKAMPNPFRFRDEGLPPFDRAEFLDAFHYAYKAAHFGGSPFPAPSDHSISIEREGGGVDELRFTDIPENRIGLAIARRYRQSPEKAQNFLLRYFALGAAFSDIRMGQWRRASDDPEQDEIHEAVFHAAAITEVGRDLSFNLDSFFSNVARIAAEMCSRG